MLYTWRWLLIAFDEGNFNRTTEMSDPRIWETKEPPFGIYKSRGKVVWLELLMPGKEQKHSVILSECCSSMKTRQRPMVPRVQMWTLSKGVCLWSPYNRHCQQDYWPLRERNERGTTRMAKERAMQPHGKEADPHQRSQWSPEDNLWVIPGAPRKQRTKNCVTAALRTNCNWSS